MESVKKWLSERSAKRNGLYVHYSPPKAVGVVSGAQLRQWARSGEESRLERAVLAGQGHRLLAEAEALHLSNHLPHLVAKCDALHNAVEKGSLLELQELLESDYNRRKYVMCRDEAGVGLLHKAIFYDFMDIAQYLVANYPQLVHEKDSEGRTPLHYACMCRDEAVAAALLEGAGAVRGARDAAGRTPSQYRGQARTLLTLPTVPSSDMARENTKNPPGLVIKRHNIRIWCHDCDMARLQRVVWEGHGSRLLSEVSSQPVVKRFLEAVPYIMNTIRDIHSSVISNDLEGVVKHAGDPVPPQALSSRDANNMTVMHKAAGLGHSSIMKYVVERYPQGINDVDNDGRTPLHYAAAMRDEQHTYNTLVSLGADEGIVDNKNRTPAYYINRPQEIDKNLFKTLPEAPRTPSSAYPSNWDWKLLDTGVITELNKKSRRRHFKASSENISSKNNTTTISDTTDRTGAMKASSTHELIKDLPDLDDTSKANKDNIDAHEQNNIENNEDTEETETKGAEEVQGEEIESKPSDADLCDKNDKVEETKAEIEPSKEIKNEEILEADARTVEEHTEKKDGSEDTEKNTEIAAEQHQNDVENNIEKVSEQNSEETTAVESTTNDIEKVESEETEINPETKNEEKSNNDDGAKNDNNEVKNDNNEVKSDNDEVKKDLEKHIHEVEESKPEINEDKETEENDQTKHKEIDTKDQNECTDDNADTMNHKDTFGDDNFKEETSSIEKESHESNQNNGGIEDVNTQNAENSDTANKEGNNNEHTEDDDDVQVQRDTQSDYNDFNQKSTAEISDGSAKRGNAINGRSTQESLIEGIINNEAEQDSQDASMNQNDASVHEEMYVIDSEIDPEVTDLINNSNMEMLATLVLNGEGSRLIGRRSENVELQAFLDNVPTYMQKINKVHVAAREGNIRDLQAALDRRKFAIARDPISPNGATPLHVATVFGKTNIIKYLGGRFPETLSAVDFEGRTSLHYAAVLPDNGHYYNLLQQLGANSKDLDDTGKSAEEYYMNPCLLPFDQLLTDFGVSEDAVQNMFADKVPQDHVSARRVLEVPEALDTLERCYRLLASARPSRNPLSASSNKATPPLVLGRFLKREIYDTIKHRITKHDHDLFDVIWPAVKKLPNNKNVIQTVEEDFPGGVTAPDYYVYEVFHEFIIPLIKDLHNLNVYSDLPVHPKSDFAKTSSAKLSSEPLVELNIDPNDEFVLSGTIECSRNVEGYELPLNLKIGKLETIERIVTTIIMQEEFAKFSEQSNPESDQKGGSYYTLNEVLEKPSEICADLASNGLLIALCDREEIDDYTRLHGKHWPYGRGVFVSEDKSVAIWINVHDHIRVLVSTAQDAPGEIGLPFSKLSYIMSYLHEKLEFVWDEKLGHLSSRPTFLGASIRFSLIVNFLGLSKDPDNMKHLCAMRGLQYRETLSSDIARISTARSANSHMDIPIFHTEEGRYLAKCKLPIDMLNNKMNKLNDKDVYLDDMFTALGDPLIKGLTEVANVKPKDPVAFLASFLHNFPEQEKPPLNTQESQVVVMREAGEVENEQAPPVEAREERVTIPRNGARTATRPHRPIDVVTVDPQPVLSPDAPETAFSSINRDEHGQSMLHFAAARSHARNALFQLLQESDISLGYRDELYRTARDVSIQANVPENTAEIDRWVLHMAARGNTDKIMELLLEGYDHILDVTDENGQLITEVMMERGDTEMGSLLASIPAFEESRETLHGAVRRGDLTVVQELLSGEGAHTLARSRNSFGRTALHIAVLAQHEEVVAYLAENFPELLRVGDNLERTPLHYAMGVEKIESISQVLIRAGAKRVFKDLKGRQPSYYFMNKSDILRLMEEEEVY